MQNLVCNDPSWVDQAGGEAYVCWVHITVGVAMKRVSCNSCSKLLVVLIHIGLVRRKVKGFWACGSHWSGPCNDRLCQATIAQSFMCIDLYWIDQAADEAYLCWVHAALVLPLMPVSSNSHANYYLQWSILGWSEGRQICTYRKPLKVSCMWFILL